MVMKTIRRLGSAILFLALALALAATAWSARAQTVADRIEMAPPAPPPAADAAGKGVVTLTDKEVDEMLAQLAEAPAKYVFGPIQFLLAKRVAAAPPAAQPLR